MPMRAQSTVEYGLLIATIAIATLLAALSFGESLRRWLETLSLRVMH